MAMKKYNLDKNSRLTDEQILELKEASMRPFSFDEVHSSYEDRYITIGLAGKVLMVVYTFRNPLYRIISARIATERERRAYFNGYEKI